MAEKKITPENTVLVAIDIAKHRNEVLIAEPGRRRRRRMVILNGIVTLIEGGGKELQ